MDSEKTDLQLQLLEEQYAALKDEISDMGQRARQSLQSLNAGSKDAISFDVYRFRQHKDKLERQLPILEIKLRRERDRVLKQRRIDKEQALEALQLELNVTKAKYHEAQDALEKAWTAHALLETKAYQLEESSRIDYEDLRANARKLQSLITEVTGVEEEELNQTENLLIRN